MKVCKGQLYSMYNCHSQAFTTDEFFVFKSIAEGTHDHIYTCWVQNDLVNPTMFDLNCDAEHLEFVVNGTNIYAKRRNEETCRMEPITREAFVAMVEVVKSQCTGILTLPRSIFWQFACTCCSLPLLLCLCLHVHVINFVDMILWQGMPPSSYKSSNAVSLNTQFWMHLASSTHNIGCNQMHEITLLKHLDTLKNWYCNVRVIGSGIDKEVIFDILDWWSLDSQQGYFKIVMKSNAHVAMEPPYDINHVTRRWAPYMLLGCFYMGSHSIWSSQN